MAAVPYNIRGREVDASLVDDVAAMLDELYADLDGVLSGDGGTHSLLSASHVDTTPGTVVRGDIITGQGANPTWKRLQLGTSGHFVKSDGTDTVFAAIQETDIVDGSIFGRLAATESIAGTWTFAALRLAASAYLSGSGGQRLIAHDGSSTVRVGDPLSNNNGTITFYTGTTIRLTITNAAVTVASAVQLRMGDIGSASAPNIAHGTDTNTGIWWNNDDTLRFSAGGTDRMRLTTTGLMVGSAIASPTVKLDVLNDAIAATQTPTLRLANTTAAVVGTQAQYSPSLVLSGTAWDVDGAASKTVRVAVYAKPIAGNSPQIATYIAQDTDGAGTFTDEFVIGTIASGDTPRFGIRDGNLVFRNAGRGISFVSAPMTSATDSGFLISGDTSGGLNRIKFNAVPGYVFIESNNASAVPGTTPAMLWRLFDGSTAVPMVASQYRATKGGGPSAGFGIRNNYEGDSTTTTNQAMCYQDVVWSDPTHATRSADFVIGLVDNAAAIAEKYRFASTGLATIPSVNVSSGALGNVRSDVYTPTRSAEANLDANATMFEAQWMRVRNTVTVSGRFTADPTAPGAASFEMTLPIASNIGAVEDLAGVAFCGAIAGQGAQIEGSVANDTAVVKWIAADLTAQSWSFTFTYQVI